MDRVTLMLGLAVPLLGLGLVSAAVDMLHEAPVKLCAVIAALVMLTLAWHLGTLSDVSFWLTRKENAVAAMAAGVVVAAGTGMVAWMVGRHRFRHLRWRAVRDPETFERDCLRYLQSAGWTIESQAGSSDFRIRKQATALHVQCRYELVSPTWLAGVPRRETALVISRLPLSGDIMHEARGLRLRLIHYTQLAVLDALLATPVPDKTPAAWQILLADRADAATVDAH